MLSIHHNLFFLSLIGFFLAHSSLFFSFHKFMFVWFWFHFCSYKDCLILLIYVSFSISFILFQWFWYVGGYGIGWVWSWDRLWAPYVCEYASKRNRETNMFEFLELHDCLRIWMSCSINVLRSLTLKLIVIINCQCNWDYLSPFCFIRNLFGKLVTEYLR